MPKETCVVCGTDIANPVETQLPFRKELKDDKNSPICDVCIEWAFLQMGVIHHRMFCDDDHGKTYSGNNLLGDIVDDLPENIIKFPGPKNNYVM